MYMHIDILHYQDATSREIALLASFLLLLFIHSRPMMTTATSITNRKRRATVTPVATGVADSLCTLTVMGELVAVVGERDGDSRDGDRRDRLMTFVAADDGADELKAYTLVGTVKRKSFM